MRFRLILLFVAAFFTANSQTTEKFFDFQWQPCEPNEARFHCVITKTDSGYVRKDFFTHEKYLQMAGKYDDPDCKIPNGYFHYYYANRKLESKGAYVHGKMDGLWLRFHSNGMMSDSTVYNMNYVHGTSLSWYPNGYMADSTVVNGDGSGVKLAWFDNGSPSVAGYYARGWKQTGKWKYYHNNGRISSIEIFNEGKLTDKTYFDEEGKQLTDTTTLDREAEFPGGKSAWQKYLFKKLYFPEQYQFVNGDQAVVVISFTVNEEGKMEDVFVSTPFYPEFDKIAESVIAHSPKWTPAMNHNRKVKFWVRQPVVFSQDQ